MFQKFITFKSSVNASQTHLLTALQNDIKAENNPATVVKVEIEDSFEEDHELRTYFEEFSQIVNPTIKEELELEKQESPSPPKLKKRSVGKVKQSKSTRPSDIRQEKLERRTLKFPESFSNLILG